LDELAAQQLTDREAEEEVSEPAEVGPFGHVDWPEEPDPLGHLIALVEDIRNTLVSFAPAVSAGVANEGPVPDSAIPPAPGTGPPTTPGLVEPPANPGHLNPADLWAAAEAILFWINGEACIPDNKPVWRDLAQRIHRYGDAIK
jgi:hypothetical protein